MVRKSFRILLGLMETNNLIVKLDLDDKESLEVIRCERISYFEELECRRKEALL